MFKYTTAQHFYCTNTVQLYSVQLNCTYCNYTEAAAKQHIDGTNKVQTFRDCNELSLYRSYLYMFSCTTEQHIYCSNTLQNVQLTCTYSNYTEVNARCSVSQNNAVKCCQLFDNIRVSIRRD